MSALPPLPDALRAQLDGLRPVAPRRPWRTWALVSLLALFWVTGVDGWLHTHRARWHAWPPVLDGNSSAAAPVAWAVLALLWLVAFAAPLAAALLPPTGSVLPEAARARRWAGGGVALALLAGALLGPLESSQSSSHVAMLPAILTCLRFGLLVSLVPLVLGWVVLRRVALVGRASLGAALGAAAGATGALALHGECALGGMAHVAIGHGATVLVGALVGYLLGALVD